MFRDALEALYLALQTQQQVRSSRQAGTHMLNVLIGQTLNRHVQGCTRGSLSRFANSATGEVISVGRYPLAKRADRANPQSTRSEMQNRLTGAQTFCSILSHHSLRTYLYQSLRQQSYQSVRLHLHQSLRRHMHHATLRTAPIHTITVTILQRHTNPHSGTASLRAVAIFIDGKYVLRRSPSCKMADCTKPYRGPTPQKLGYVIQGP